MKLSDLFDPMVIGLAVMLGGLVTWHRASPKRSMRLARALAWAGFAWLVLASCPLVANSMVAHWQPAPVDLGAALAGTSPEQRALVVLSAGKRNELAFVPNVEQLDGESQGRLLGAARIYKTYEFATVVVTGTGQPFVDSMADLLIQLGVPRERIVRETQATDTKENARFTAPLLEPLHPQRIVLVTSAIHMRRSVMHFRRAGMDVVPAPVDYVGGATWKLLPSSKHLGRTSSLLHELIGFLEP